MLMENLTKKQFSSLPHILNEFFHCNFGCMFRVAVLLKSEPAEESL